MKVHVRGMLRQVVSLLEKKEKGRPFSARDKMGIGMYQASLTELSENLQKLADDPSMLDEFLTIYCLKK